MAPIKAVYLVVSGASSACFTPDLLEALTQINLSIYTLLTDGAQNIISPYRLADQQGHKLIDSYFDPLLVNGRQPGLTLIAPATFNTLNKISHGIADTLPHSLVAEAIGAKWPVIVVPSMNPELGNHPQVAHSIDILRQWGVTVLEPRVEGKLLVMAPIDEIVAAVRDAL